MSFPFVFCEEDDGVGQCGGSRFNLLHHHLSGAVDGEDVAREVLAGPSCCTAGRAWDWGDDMFDVMYVWSHWIGSVNV